jgi:hypothetical protein
MSRAIVIDNCRLSLPEDVFGEDGLEVGGSYEVIRYDHGMFFIPLRPIEELQGMFEGMDTSMGNEE